MSWDEGPDVGGSHAPYRQSERSAIYRKHTEELIDKDKAFYCFCTPEELDKERKEQQARKEAPRYSGVCREISKEEAAHRVADGEKHVVRFKMPKDGSITAKDYLRGDITVENRTLDDKVLLKSDGHALYHLAAMVDDHLMGISHVFRGEEWLPSLPLHAHIYEAFGWEQPTWVHLSVFLKPTGKGKMSKRETESMKGTGQSIFVKDFAELGYMPEAINNWIALMGWSLDDHTEFFGMKELIEGFSLDGLNPAPSAIDFKKLDHFNGLHIRNLSAEELAQRLKPYYLAQDYHPTLEQLAEIVPLIQTRLATLDDAPELTAFLFKDSVDVAAEEIPGKGMDPSQTKFALESSLNLLKELPFSAEAMDQPMRDLAEELGLKAGQLFTALRNAVTGQRISPPLFESMELLGQTETFKRLAAAITKLN